MSDLLASKVVILEDVVTTGGSTLKCADTVKSAGLSVAGVIAIVDRLEGGREAIEAAGLPLFSLYTRRDFGKITLSALPLAKLATAANPAADRPNSRFGGVQIGIITYMYQAQFGFLAGFSAFVVGLVTICSSPSIRKNSG